MPDDQDGCEWVFLLVPAYPGSPGSKAVKQLCVCYLVLSHISSEFSIDAWQSASLDGPLVQSSQNCCRRESTVAWTLMKI